MPSELMVQAVNHDAMRVDATAGEHVVCMDYPVQPGNAGFTPLQLLLASLAGCSANSLAVILRSKMKQPVRTIEVSARGLRREEHPTVITDITLAFVVHGTGVDTGAVQKALQLSEETICPVWAMLKPGTPIRASFRVVED